MAKSQEKDNLRSGNKDKESFPTVSSGGSGECSAGGPIEKIGSQIGPYKLLSVLGEGGFGIVYQAEQKEPVRRQVALKVIKPGMDSKQVISRFETERQALALLDHSNIAHVFDAGTTESGRPYFVMEYVKGVPITEHCDQEKLSIEERLKLFIQVCEAIQHAHQKGIIHRDIKPSNILVSAQDDKPIPKIIDFGVAKAVSQLLTERTLFTEQGQLLGTPEYMSPEQAQLTNQDIDTRSDIYSLGVLLYEILTGALPFDPKTLREAAFDEILRIIREEDPPRPSTRLSGLEEEGKKVAENRRTQLITLAKRLQKELEWIPLKAMRKEREHRYESASELAEDIRNYLDGNPLIAGPESVAYRLNKFVRRHRALVTGVTAVLVVLIGGIVVSTIFAIKAERESLRTKEESEARRRALYINRIALAEKKVGEGELAEAQTLLNKCDSDLRSWEWEWLDYLSHRIIRVIEVGESFSTVAFSPDGSNLAFAGSDNLRVWDLKSDCEVFEVNIVPHNLARLKFGPCGRKVVVMGGGCLQAWDAQSGRELWNFSKGQSRSIKHGDFIFLADGKCIAAIPGSGAGIWDVETGEKLADFAGDDSLMAFAPDGRSLAVCSSDDPCSFYLWDVDANTRSRAFGDHRDSITCISFSPDCSLVATGCEDSSIKIWGTKTGTEITTLYGHSGPICEVVFSPDGTKVASAARHSITGVPVGDLGFAPVVRSVDQSILTWDVQTWNKLTISQNPGGPVQHMTYNPEGSLLVSIDHSGIAHLWDVEPKPTVLLPRKPGFDFSDDAIGVLGFSSDCDRIIISTPRGIEIVSATTGAKTSQIDGVFIAWGPIHFYAISKNGGRLVAEQKGELRQWNLEDVRDSSIVRIESPDPDDIISVAFVSQDRNICCISKKMISFIDVDTYNKTAELIAPKGTFYSGHIADVGNGKIVVGAYDTNNKTPEGTFSFLLVVDKLRKQEPTMLWNPKMAGVSLLTTPKGNRLVAITAQPDLATFSDILFDSASWNIKDKSIHSNARFWKIHPGGRLSEHEDSEMLRGWILAVSPDTRRVACVGIPYTFNDGTIRILETKTGEEVLSLKHDRSILAAAFSPNGRQIATSGADGSLVLWGPPMTGDDGFDRQR